MSIKAELRFTGGESDKGKIEFYDVAQALIGFERSLAITAHAVLNGEVITQAPSLRGARLLVEPPEAGSWKIVAGIVGTVWAAGQASHDSVVGHIMYSAYDYVISGSLGVHVDFDKSLGQLIEESKEKNIGIPELNENRLDSVIEKCEVAIKNLHRPMVQSQSADQADVKFIVPRGTMMLSTILDRGTYDYISQTKEIPESVEISGFVTSYNSNTYKGRIFTVEDQRPIPFELSEEAQIYESINLVTASLRSNALARSRGEAKIYMIARKLVSPSGVIKKYIAYSVSNSSMSGSI
ncbi:hypothetical protein KFK14_20230 [Sphingobium phenoxybenzoativorans]|uniref:Uncharacterized protein n=1 Tax=Sphingobium phenoxybenzoativorans TaxID=1592790 RepID=A0A975K5Q9_9SPHN|nr:hypothetical protein [Sphingobium phenoxybenzoativorans]QUT05295.1 hypothetical protein KFK14_20230 [Sphingobium phenoxybenzoativorans]